MIHPQGWLLRDTSCRAWREGKSFPAPFPGCEHSGSSSAETRTAWWDPRAGTSTNAPLPYPCGSEMSPPALTHPSHFALSVFIESFIFCISTHRNVPVWLIFFFSLFKINLERVLLPKVGSHPSRCSADLVKMAGTQEPGFGCPGDLGELYKHMLLIWDALF